MTATTARLGFLDRLLPKSALASPEERRRGRLFVVSCFILVAAALFFAQQTIASDDGEVSLGAGILIGGAILGALNLPVAKETNSLKGPGIAITMELVVVLSFLGWIGAGVRDASLYWLVIAPLVGTFLIGPRGGAVVGFIAISVVVGFFVAETTGFKTFTTPDEEAGWFMMLGATTVMAGIGGIAWLYETSRRQAFALVESTLAQLNARAEEAARANDAVRRAAADAEAESRRKTELIERMRDAARAQGEALESTRRGTADVARTVRTIAATVETLVSASRHADAATSESDALQAMVSRAVKETVAAVDETSGALQELDRAVAVVVERFDGLRRAAESTSRAMVKMEDNAVQVGENASATAALSEEVINDADRGADAVRRSREGIDAIRDTARTAGGVIRRLGDRVDAIGAIVTVIDEVAKETNVLALNASIIAAQAGERGRGFGVVADQIKGLADRTAASTREIAGLVAAVQDETKNAVDAIRGGEGAVDAGVALSQEASAALEQIVASARAATERVRAIADATSEQARAAREVAEAMGRVSRLVGEAAQAADLQSAASARITATTKKMRDVVPELERASERQAETGRRVRDATGRIAATAVQLGEVQGQQTRGAESIDAALEKITQAQVAQIASLDRFSGAGR